MRFQHKLGEGKGRVAVNATLNHMIWAIITGNAPLHPRRYRIMPFSLFVCVCAVYSILCVKHVMRAMLCVQCMLCMLYIRVHVFTAL